MEVPSRYVRKSELRFVSGPMKTLAPDVVPKKKNCPTHGVSLQAPTGCVGDSVNNGSLSNRLNTSGFLQQISDTDPNLPGFLNGVVGQKRRLRLMEFKEPSEKFSAENLSRKPKFQRNACACGCANPWRSVIFKKLSPPPPRPRVNPRNLCAL